MNLLDAARKETEWARALRIGLERHGSTPIYDALRAALTATSGDADGRVRAGGEVAG